LRTALADPDARATLAGPVIKVPLIEPEVNVSPPEASDECALSEECIDQYLWSVYDRTRKVDTIKVQERIKRQNPVAGLLEQRGARSAVVKRNRRADESGATKLVY
jgi:hypothetical protein